MRLPDHYSPIVTERVCLRIPDDETLSEVEATLELTSIVTPIPEGMTPDRLRLRGSARFTHRVPCARCLVEVEAPVETTFETLIDLAAGTIEASDLEAEPEPGGFERIGADAIDLSEEIRQRVHLATSDIAYCRPDCKGLCSRCGQDLNRRECGCDRTAGGGAFDGLRSLLD